ncbi:MAG: hypothetical protein BJ554DRAFT_6118 [Olpidium bornovanus]|uniref:ABC transporter domain-containing protein n=1 Tax=Olpidium bornovanus TaxID=278681 RepID=A0A8H7ZY15_9FUNG|nr:MAG: hypothetical protein BJ554DRAFT_6118 [Olpidium bornovanus]
MGFASDVHGLVRDAVPGVDDAIVEYIVGYLADSASAAEDADLPDAIADFVKPMLLDAGGAAPAVERVCEELSAFVLAAGGADGDHAARQQRRSRGPAKLAQPINMLSQASMSLTVDLTRGTTDLTHVGGNRIQSQVDTKKLQKAEMKIKAKMEKRERRADYEASKLLTATQANEQFLAVNPILDYTTTRGKVKDIKIEDFDISYAGMRIVTNASLTLAYGRRYGLVGRNGVGKSTLLRSLSRREINVPSHISILHVEQEVRRPAASAARPTPASTSILGRASRGGSVTVTRDSRNR